MILDLGSAAKPARVANPPLTQKSLPEVPDGYWRIFDQIANEPPPGQTSTLEYPTVNQVANAPMKVIPLQSIPTFHEMIIEDLNAFLFEVDFICRGYDYTTDPQKLKLFPSTLKEVALRWFMGLDGRTINS